MWALWFLPASPSSQCRVQRTGGPRNGWEAAPSWCCQPPPQLRWSEVSSSDQDLSSPILGSGLSCLWSLLGQDPLWALHPVAGTGQKVQLHWGPCWTWSTCPQWGDPCRQHSSCPLHTGRGGGIGAPWWPLGAAVGILEGAQPWATGREEEGRPTLPPTTWPPGGDIVPSPSPAPMTLTVSLLSRTPCPRIEQLPTQGRQAGLRAPRCSIPQMGAGSRAPPETRCVCGASGLSCVCRGGKEQLGFPLPPTAAQPP